MQTPEQQHLDRLIDAAVCAEMCDDEDAYQEARREAILGLYCTLEYWNLCMMKARRTTPTQETA